MRFIFCPQCGEKLILKAADGDGDIPRRPGNTMQRMYKQYTVNRKT